MSRSEGAPNNVLNTMEESVLTLSKLADTQDVASDRGLTNFRVIMLLHKYFTDAPYYPSTFLPNNTCIYSLSFTFTYLHYHSIALFSTLPLPPMLPPSLSSPPLHLALLPSLSLDLPLPLPLPPLIMSDLSVINFRGSHWSFPFQLYSNINIRCCT